MWKTGGKTNGGSREEDGDMEKRRWRTRLIVVAVLAVLVLVFGPKKLGWLVPGPDEAVTGYVMYELFSGSGAHDPAGEGLEELRTVLDDTWVLWWGVSNVIPMEDAEDNPSRLEIYTEERIPAASFELGSDGLLYAEKLRFRPLNADLLAALGLHTRQAAPAAAKQPAPLSDIERRVLAGIGPKPVGIEELCVSTGLPMSALLGTLMKLELTGRVYKQPGQRYVLR